MSTAPLTCSNPFSEINVCFLYFKKLEAYKISKSNKTHVCMWLDYNEAFWRPKMHAHIHIIGGRMLRSIQNPKAFVQWECRAQNTFEEEICAAMSRFSDLTSLKWVACLFGGSKNSAVRHPQGSLRQPGLATQIGLLRLQKDHWLADQPLEIVEGLAV